MWSQSDFGTKRVDEFCRKKENSISGAITKLNLAPINTGPGISRTDGVRTSAVVVTQTLHFSTVPTEIIQLIIYHDCTLKVNTATIFSIPSQSLFEITNAVH